MFRGLLCHHQGVKQLLLFKTVTKYILMCFIPGRNDGKLRRGINTGVLISP